MTTSAEPQGNLQTPVEVLTGEIPPPAQETTRDALPALLDEGAGTTIMTVADLPEADQERIHRFKSKSRAGNTSRAYESQVKHFSAWLKGRGNQFILPIAPVLIASWLTERAEAGASRSTLSVALAAVKAAHRVLGYRFDAADPDLVTALAGASREAVREQRQAAPLRPALLGEILSSLGDCDQDRRDAAMLSLLYMLALRRSELAEIDYQTRGDGLAVLRLTVDGIELSLLKSKASQDKPVVVGLDRDHNPRGFAALERWIVHANIQPGEPRLILLDEPFGALDQQTRLLMGDDLLRLWRKTGATVFLITHALDEATMLADRIAVMSARPGRIMDLVETGWVRGRDSRVVERPEFGAITARLWRSLREVSLKTIGRSTGGRGSGSTANGGTGNGGGLAKASSS